LQAIFTRWDEAKRDLSGQALLDARREIAKDAMMQLGGSDGLLKFLEFLKKEGQGDLREWVTTEGIKDLFASPEKGAVTAPRHSPRRIEAGAQAAGRDLDALSEKKRPGSLPAAW
jgi:hypothetical protein